MSSKIDPLSRLNLTHPDFGLTSTENGYLANWYLSPFQVEGTAFSSAEQFMMYRKALLFHDEDTAGRILATENVAEIKALGRQVKNYVDQDWNGVRQIVMMVRDKLK